MRSLPPKGEALIKGSERLVLRVYDDRHPKKVLKPGDPVDGVLTGGWGHTGGLKIGDTVTREVAQRWFDSDVLEKAIKPLYAKLGAEVIDQLTDNQFGALVSFVFNLGTGDPKKREWTIWKRLRAGAYDQVPLEMIQFVNWDGKKSRGLVNRRNAEIALWSTDEPGSAATNPPSSVTRREPTPPTPADPTPPHKSATVLSGAIGVAATVPVAAKQITDAVEPYKDASPMVAQVIAIIATVAAVAAVVVLALTWLKKREARS